MELPKIYASKIGYLAGQYETVPPSKAVFDQLISRNRLAGGIWSVLADISGEQEFSQYRYEESRKYRRLLAKFDSMFTLPEVTRPMRDGIRLEEPIFREFCRICDLDIVAYDHPMDSLSREISLDTGDGSIKFELCGRADFIIQNRLGEQAIVEIKFHSRPLDSEATPRKVYLGQLAAYSILYNLNRGYLVESDGRILRVRCYTADELNDFFWRTVGSAVFIRSLRVINHFHYSFLDPGKWYQPGKFTKDQILDFCRKVANPEP